MSLLPQQPNFSRALGEQIFFWKSLRYGEALCALAHQHHVRGMQHHCARQQRNIFDVLDRAHRTRGAGGAVHAAGIKLHFALFVGQPAQPHAVVSRIILLAFAYVQHRIEGIFAAHQHVVGGINALHSFRLANDHRFFCGRNVGRGLRLLAAIGVLFSA